eukprot:CAMPEP_0113922228 /NCGR_PEP_ID=MMETSP1159-20121227/1500_1 /TAXON_ID=88271 /ORGANISM="Picocystis salinarum" /LENGTH=181 /DNA_ID=CAMNT_0000922321 /DNA_START=456 /DNA_END=997 /DNA_ORIENTATION=- /assembly_acc=CAM_ASM_000767
MTVNMLLRTKESKKQGASRNSYRKVSCDLSVGLSNNFMPSHQPDDGQCTPNEDELHDGVVATKDPAVRIGRVGSEFCRQSLFHGVRPTSSILRFALPPVPFDVQGHEVGEKVEVPRQEHNGIEFLRFEGHTSARFGGLYFEEEHQDGRQVAHVPCKSKEVHLACVDECLDACVVCVGVDDE